MFVKKYLLYVWFFYNFVDVDVLGFYNYYDVVKNFMDFGMIKVNIVWVGRVFFFLFWL